MPTSRAVPSMLRDRTGRNRAGRAEPGAVDRAIGNRALLAERLEYEMVRHARHERPLALFAVEVDRPEAVAGAAAALRRALRAQDTVAHVGGRGLCVLAPETDRYAAPPLSRRVREAVAGAGVGFALFPHDARSARELVARAAAGARAHPAERPAPCPPARPTPGPARPSRRGSARRRARRRRTCRRRAAS